MEEEILNIQYHTRRLLLKALNQEKTAEGAAPKLGICVRSVYQYKKMFNIKLIGDQFQVVEKNQNNGKNESTRTGYKRSHGIH